MTFLLVHGSWMSARCWKPAQAILEAHGHRTLAIDLPGHGANEVALADLSLDLYVNQVLDTAKSFGEPVVLVGHSMAGVVISQAAERSPGSFARLVYVAAYLPVNGQSLNDLAQSDADSLIGPNMRPAADWSTLDLEATERGNLFFQDCADVAQPYLDSWRAEPVAPLTVPLELGEAFASVPRSYLHTTRDRVVSPQLQRRMLAATPTPTVEFESGHLPMLVDPAKFVSVLLSMVGDRS